MVIRYRGTSPKLGSCQGECPYPCDYFLGGDGGGNDGGVVAFFFSSLRLRLKFPPSDPHSRAQVSLSFCIVLPCCPAKKWWDRLDLREA